MYTKFKYIATIHTGRGSYRVPGAIDGCLSNEISRIFEIAQICGVDDCAFDDVYKLIEKADNECDSLNYRRYDCIDDFDHRFEVEVDTIYCALQKVILSCIGENSFKFAYQDILLSELNYQIPGIKESCICQCRIQGYDCLLMRFDVDKTMLILIINNEDGLYNLNNIEQSAKNWSNGYGEKPLMSVCLYSAIEEEETVLIPYKEHLVLRFDDFVMLLNQSNRDLKELYYYWQDRNQMFENLKGSEIDVFCSYWANKHTFYSTSVSFNPCVGRHELFCKMKCDWEQLRDLHLVNAAWGPCMVSRFTDFHEYLPLYKPAATSDQDILVCQYLQAQLFVQCASEDPTKQIVHQEIAKSLLIWMLAIECRFHEPLLFDDIHLFVRISNKDNYQVLKDREAYLIDIPEDSLINKDIQHYAEPTILKNLLVGLNHFGVRLSSDYLKKIRTVFRECDGHILQINDNPEILLMQDGIRGTYNVNERCCDKILSDVAEFIGLGGTETLLSVEESGMIANKIQDYLIGRINSILEKNASVKLVTYLLRLEHSLLFWQSTSQGRYIGIESVLEYMGVNFTKQKEYANQYAETSNLTKLFIERLVKNDYPFKERLMSCTDFDTLYALGHQYYNISMYLDLLKFEKENARLTILRNGRFALPTDCFDKSQAYMADLRVSEYDGVRKHLAIYKDIPEFCLNTESKEFQEAFFDEYNITYPQYNKVLFDCIGFGANSMRIVSIAEKEFEYRFIQKNEVDYNSFKKHFVLSEKASHNLKYSEFAVHRHNRNFQVSTRPWILYNGNIYFSYKILYRHWFILRDRIEQGRLRADSDRMKSFIGNINRQKGDAFNDALYKYYVNRNIPSLGVYKNVKIAPDKLLDASDDLGDIDLLLVDTLRKKILCIELKNYRECRSLLDLYDQIHKVDEDLGNVLKRDAWCKYNIVKFKNIQKDVTPSYTLTTYFLTYNMQAAKYIQVKEYPNIQFLEMRALIDNPECILDR